MKADRMRFPVLQLNEHHIERFKSPRWLRKMSRRNLDREAFTKDAVFIDSDGNRYPLIEIRKVRRSWHILDLGARSTIFIVEIEIGEPTPMSLDEVKRAIIDLVVRKGWYSQGGESASQFRDAMEATRSVPELFDQISYYGKF